MRVRRIDTWVSPIGLVLPGEIAEMDDDLARLHIRDGSAVEVGAEPVETAPRVVPSRPEPTLASEVSEFHPLDVEAPPVTVDAHAHPKRKKH